MADDFVPDDDFIADNKPEGFLQAAIKQQSKVSPMQRGVSFAVGGPTTMAGPVQHAEDAAVPATQMISDLGLDASGMGFLPGVKPAITTGATALAETGRQGVKAMEGGQFNPSEIGKTAAITGGTELAGRGIGNFLMGKAASRAAATEGQQAISGMKEALGKAGDMFPSLLKVPKDEILTTMQNEFSKTTNPMGLAGTVFKRWIKILSDPGLTHIDPRMAMEMESDFGQASKFSQGNSFMENLINKSVNPVKKPALNASAKVVRTAASNMVDDMADNAGIKGFPEASKRFSEAKFDLASAPHNFMQNAGKYGEIGLDTFLGNMVHHPLIGAGIGIGDVIRKNPSVQDLIYNTIGKTGIGALGMTGASEKLRQATQAK